MQLDYVDIVFANKSDSLTPTEGKTDPFAPAAVPVGRIFRVEGKNILSRSYTIQLYSYIIAIQLQYSCIITIQL